MGQRMRDEAGSDSTRRPGIQGLRAVAVLAVVAFHAGLPVSGGFIGVDIFFVISGLVITGMLHRQWLREGRIRMRSFYGRRFRRLIPALAVMVTLTVCASALLLPPFGAQQNTAQTGVGAMLMAANFLIAEMTGDHFDVAAESNALLHTWSLSVEEQSYLLFPAALALSWVIANRHRGLRVAPVISVALVGSASLAIVLLHALGRPVTLVPEWLVGFYGPVGRAWEFAAGALLALAVPHLVRLGRGSATAMGVLGAGAVLASL
jgi:peptidoglycan/LPS O-acetylase OafA/YrhL